MILEIITKAKPVLLKLFPREFLQRMKRRMVEKNLKKIEQIPIEPFEHGTYRDGINLIGNIKAETGLGQSCRLVASELENSGLEYSVCQYSSLGTMTERDYPQFAGKISDELPYNINLIHINPYDLGLAFTQNHQRFWDKRYNIGFWLWELEEFPTEWKPCFHCLNEIWTPSEFISNAVRKQTTLPVVTLPYHLSMPENVERNRKLFNLPEDLFLYLVMYDRTSMTKRKNPEGAISAFKQAFSSGEKVGLVLKINSCTAEEIELLKKELSGIENVYFLTEVLPREQVNVLLKSVDAVVSLHRAEGFGLVLAEAMLLGTPTIATNWSSNTEFMTKETACLVDYQLVELTEDIGLFKKGNRWAEPDVKQAADYMRKLYNSPEYCKSISVNAERYVKEHLSAERTTAIIRERVEQIYGREHA